MNFKTIGTLTFFIALIVLGYGFTFDTTISTGLGRVHNIGLMNEKQNIIILGGALLIAGVLLFAFSSANQNAATTADGYRQCPSCAEMVKDEAKICRHCRSELPEKVETSVANVVQLPDGQKLCSACNQITPIADLACRHCGVWGR